MNQPNHVPRHSRRHDASGIRRGRAAMEAAPSGARRGLATVDGIENDARGARRGIERPAVSWLRRVGLFALVAPVLLALSAAAALGVWRSSAATQTAGFAAGHLSVTLADLTWDCPDQGASGDAASLPDFRIAPGQTITLRQEIGTDTVGDNMHVALSVDFPNLPAGVVGEWHLEADAAQVAPASGDVSLDEALVLPDLNVTNWEVVVRLTLPAGDLVWVDPTATSSPQPQALSLGAMTVSAAQIRCGAGFTVPCGSEVVDE